MPSKDKNIKLLKWIDKAKEYIENDARNKYPLAKQLIREINEIEKEFDSVK